VTQQNATFLGAAVGCDHQIRTGPRLLYDASTPQVPPSYVYSFGSYRVDTQTNTHTQKPTHKPTNRFRQKHPTFFALLQCWIMTSVRIRLHMLSDFMSSAKYVDVTTAVD